MNKKLLSLYSLKFNPFSPQIPASALWLPPWVEDFCWRIEQQVGEGGFALTIGDPGTGKSAALRLLVERLNPLRDVTVGVLTRPQASTANWATSSKCLCPRTTAGPVPRFCARNGTPTSKPPFTGQCSWSMRPRK